MILAIIIAVGGATGALARYYLGIYLSRTIQIADLPISTIIINVLGSFLIGLLVGLASTTDAITDNVRNLLIIGLLGSFTTFSTFSLETVELLNKGLIIGAMANVLISVVFGILAAWLGIRLVSIL